LLVVGVVAFGSRGGVVGARRGWGQRAAHKRLHGWLLTDDCRPLAMRAACMQT